MSHVLLAWISSGKTARKEEARQVNAARDAEATNRRQRSKEQKQNKLTGGDCCSQVVVPKKETPLWLRGQAADWAAILAPTYRNSEI